MTRCTAKKGGYSETQCESLGQVSQPGGQYRRHNQKGVFFSIRVNTTTNEALGKCFTIHSGDHIHHGVVMNVCPFCKGDLRDYSDET